MRSFVIRAKTLLVEAFQGGKEASKAAKTGDVLVHGVEDMAKLTPNELKTLAGRAFTRDPAVQAYMSRAAMCEAVYERLQELSTNSGAKKEERHTTENTMATKAGAKGSKATPAKGKATKGKPATPPADETPTPPETAPEAQGKGKGKATKAAASKPSEGESGKRGRSSNYAGKRLFTVDKTEGSGQDARRHSDSRRTASRAIIKAAGARGILFEDYIAKGGHPGDLARDAKKGAVRVQ